MKKEEIEEKLELIKKYADNLAKERAGFLFGWQYKGEAHCDETTDIKLFADQILELLKSEKEKNRQEIIEKIDKIYKKEQGIHNWLDLREKLKEEIKKENYEKNL